MIHAQRRFGERIASIDTSDQDGWHILEEDRLSLINLIVGAARQWDIDPFAGYEVAPRQGFDEYYKHFMRDIESYVAQHVIGQTITSKRDSVTLQEKTKDRLRSHISALKEQIEKSSLNDARRSALLRKLRDFEQELDKRRLNYLAMTRMTLEIIAIPGAVWQSHDLAMKLVTNMLQSVGEAKAAEDAQRQIPPPFTPKAITVSRPPTSGSLGFGHPPRESFPADMDDEIPF